MLPLLVSMIISSSFSPFAWEVVPSLPKCGEMIRHVQSNTANTDLFFTKWHTATRQVYFFSACHLSLATIFGLVKHNMEEQENSNEVRAMEMLQSEH